MPRLVSGPAETSADMSVMEVRPAGRTSMLVPV